MREAYGVRVGRCMYIGLRLESGEMGEGAEESREVVSWCTVQEFHGEYEG
jgi:hypothetical protein